jgi:uncharacterized protein (DUF1330 family)
MENGNATLVVTATPNPEEMQSVQEYLGAVMPLLTGAGGSVVKRMKHDHLVNGRPAGMVLVMDFESSDAAISMFESEEYQALVPVRDRGFSEMNISLYQGM